MRGEASEARRGGGAVFRKPCLLGPSHRSSAAPAANQSAWVNPQPSRTQVATRRARRQTLALEIPSFSPTTTIERPDGNRARRSASFSFERMAAPVACPLPAHCGGPHAAVLRSSSTPVPQPQPRTVKIILPVGVVVSICSEDEENSIPKALKVSSLAKLALGAYATRTRRSDQTSKRRRCRSAAGEHRPSAG